MTTSPLKVEDSRADFEKWMTDEQWFHDSDFEWDEGRNCYSQFGIHIAYKAWLASRSAIVVELPQRQEPTSSGHYGEGYLVTNTSGTALDYEDTVDAIRAAGITVKGD